MNLQPDITSIPSKKLIGKRQQMSFAQNTTAQLWKSFIPQKGDITDRVGIESYSLQVYPPAFFRQFDVNQSFEKWAAVEVNHIENIPQGMETFTIPEGLYALFHYKGSSVDNSIFQYIFSQWLPASEYELDDRPHFEVLGDKYKNNDPNSEEDIYIPVRKKA